MTTTDVIEGTERGVFEVYCESTHLTAFAVLMDVTGALNVRNVWLLEYVLLIYHTVAVFLTNLYFNCFFT